MTTADDVARYLVNGKGHLAVTSREVLLLATAYLELRDRGDAMAEAAGLVAAELQAFKDAA